LSFRPVLSLLPLFLFEPLFVELDELLPSLVFVADDEEPPESDEPLEVPVPKPESRTGGATVTGSLTGLGPLPGVGFLGESPSLSLSLVGEEGSPPPTLTAGGVMYSHHGVS